MKEFCKLCKKINKEYELMSEDKRVNCIQGFGFTRSKIMLVTESPETDEASSGQLLSSSAGYFIHKQLLNASGINKTDVRFEAAVRCNLCNNREPTKNEIKNCRKYLVDSIKEVKPKVIIAVGGVAWKSLTNLQLSNISQWAGKPIWSNELNCWIMPISHTSVLMNGRYGKGRSDVDIFKTIGYLEIAKKLSKEESKNLPIVKKILIQTDKQLLDLIANLEKSEKFALDIETSSTNGNFSDFTIDHIIGISYCYKKNVGYYVPFSLIEKHKDKIKKLHSSNKIKGLQNCSFDSKFLKKAGIPIDGYIFDTLLSHHLLDENFSGQHGLKELAWRYTFHGGYDKELDDYKEKNKIKNYELIPLDIISKYGSYDSVVTYELMLLFEKRLKEEGLEDLFWAIVMPARRVLNDMEMTGTYVDEKYLIKLKNKLEKDMEFLGNKINILAKNKGMENFNVNSTKQLPILLFDKLNLKSTKKTKKDFDSTDAEALEALKGKHPIIETILDYKKIDTYHNTFVTGILDRIKNDNRVHTGFLSHGTVTGRLSSVDPNLQNIPRDKDIKTAFIATDGYLFIDADYSQAELRGVAHYSQDPVMMKAFIEDKDIHTMVAMEVLKKLENEISKDERVFIKTINFGIVYGRGAKALAEAMGISFEEAEKFLEKYFNRFPKVKKFIEETKVFAHKHEYVKTIFGRKRRLLDINHDDKYIRLEAERMAVNSLVQGTIADMTQTSIIRINESFKKHKIDGRILLQVHDSILSEVKKSQVKEGAQLIKQAMESPFKGFTVPMKADILICKKWGEENDSLGIVWKDWKNTMVNKK